MQRSSACPPRDAPPAYVELACPPAGLHRSPPITLRQIRDSQPWLLPVSLALVVLLSVAAAIDGGRLLAWDPPLTNAFIGLRSPGVNRVALWISRLGSTPVVIAVGAVGVALAARRCRSVALVMLVTVAARPPVEWILKAAIERPRPSGARLAPGTGFAFPSGHVLAAAATWGFVPVIAGLYVKRRWVWWALTALAWSAIGLIAWSRVWLGVHWTSDVVGGLAVAFIALSLAETVLDRQHHPPRGLGSPGGRRVGTTSPSGTGRCEPADASVVVDGCNCEERSPCGERRVAGNDDVW